MGNVLTAIVVTGIAGFFALIFIGGAIGFLRGAVQMIRGTYTWRTRGRNPVSDDPAGAE